MAEHRLDLAAVEAGYAANVRQLKTLLEAQARLREVAEQTAAETRRELERLAQALAPELVDELGRGEPLGLGQVTARALADAIVRDVQRRLGRLSVAEAAGQSAGELYEETAAELARLRQENTKLQAELTAAVQREEQTRLRLAVLQRNLEDAQRRLGMGLLATPTATPTGIAAPEITPAAPAPLRPEQLPGWVQEWQRQATFERDLALLRILAESGVARRADAARLFEERTGVQAGSGGVHRLFQRLAKMGLIEIIEATSVTRGSSIHHLLRLTEQGCDAARLLLGQEPALSQTTELLARHKSAEHALLNLEAADLLREAGYQVDLFPPAVRLPGERLFAPDLAATRDGRTIFVEVERATHKTNREHKWQNAYDASGGELYVVVPDKAALDAVKSEILFWAGQRTLTLWMTPVSDARGKTGDTMWLFKRGNPRGRGLPPSVESDATPLAGMSGVGRV